MKGKYGLPCGKTDGFAEKIQKPGPACPGGRGGGKLRLLLLALAAWQVFSACDTAFVAGLGKKVDVNPPTVELIYPAAADYIKGKTTFTALADDDTGVSKVEIAFNVYPGMPREDIKWYPAVRGESYGSGFADYWHYEFDTAPLNDGELTARLRATDRDNKTAETLDTAFTVHNVLPLVSLDSPDPNITVDNYDSYILRLAASPEQLTNQPLLISASDIQGIAPGYPRIKFWADDDPAGEPAEYSPMDYPNDWELDTDWRRSYPNGRKNVGARYWMSVRDADGKVEVTGTNDKKTGLPANQEYRYRILVKDVSGGERIFPETDKPGGLVKLITAASIPTVKVVKPAPDKGMGYGPSYEIQVDAYDTGNIDRTNIFVIDPNGKRISLEWDERKILDPPIDTGNGYAYGYRYFLTISPGISKHITDEDESQAAGGDTGFQKRVGTTTFSFANNTQYDFVIETWSLAGVTNSGYAQVGLDNKEPAIEISRINELTVDAANGPYDYVDWDGSPLTTTIKPIQDGYPGFTGFPITFVNGEVEFVTLVSGENWGLDTDHDDTSKTAIKWAVRDSNQGLDIQDQDTLKNFYEGITPGGDGGFVTNNRGKWDSTGAGTAATQQRYLYVVARDKAGNYGFTEKLLNVNQRTDYPVFTLVRLNRTISDPKDLVKKDSVNNEYSRINVFQDVEFDITLKDDDGLNMTKVAIEVYNEQGAHGSIDLAGLLPVSDSATASFTVSEARIAAALKKSLPLADGVYYLELKFEDVNIPGKKGGSGPVYFAKAAGIPEVTDFRRAPGTGAPAADSHAAGQTVAASLPMNNLAGNTGMVRITGQVDAKTEISRMLNLSLKTTYSTGNPNTYYIIDPSAPTTGGIYQNPGFTTGIISTDTRAYWYADVEVRAGWMEIEVQAVDRFGMKAQTPTLRVTIDERAPEIFFGNINAVQITKTAYTPGSALDALMAQVTTIVDAASPVLRGTFSDKLSQAGTKETAAGQNQGQYYFEYRIYDSARLTGTGADAWDAAANAWEKAYLGTSPGQNPSWSIDLTALPDRLLTGIGGAAGQVIPDGLYWLDVRVANEWGNDSRYTKASTPPNYIGNAYHIAFVIDRQPPEIAEDPANPLARFVYGAQTGTNVFTLKGTARDANLSGVTVQTGSTSESLNLTANLVSALRPQEKTYTFSWSLTKTVFDTLFEGPNTVTITARDRAGKTANKEWTFYRDTTPPEVEFINLTPGSSTNNFQETEAKIQGAARDAYGVSEVRTRIERKDYTSDPVHGTWVLVPDGTADAGGFTAVPGFVPGNNVNWIKEIGSNDYSYTGLTLGEGEYRIKVKAMDSAYPAPNEKTTDDWVEFVVDYSPPTLDVNTPPAYSNGNIISGSGQLARGIYLTGTAFDGNGLHPTETLVAKLYRGNGQVGTDITVSLSAMTSTGGTNEYAWGVLIPENAGGSDLLTDGNTYTIRLTVKDRSGKTASSSVSVTYDKTAPTANIYYPALHTTTTGAVEIRGESGDNFVVAKVEYKIGKNGVWADTGLGTGSLATGFNGGVWAWSYSLTTQSFKEYSTNTFYADKVRVDNTTTPPTYPLDSTKNIWKLPFEVRVTDMAGNQSVLPYFLILDPDGDIPKITEIRTPGSGSQMGGTIRAQGTAADNDWIYAVMVRIRKGTDMNGPWVEYPTAGNPSDTRKTNSEGWALTTLSSEGPTVNWSFNLNQFGELNGANGERQDAILEVMPIDSKARETAQVLTDVDLPWCRNNPDQRRLGDIKTVRFAVNAGVPDIRNVKVSAVNYAAGMRTRGAFTITADMTVGDSALSRIQWRSANFSPNNFYQDMLDASEPFAKAKAPAAADLYEISMPSAPIPVGSLQKGRKYFINDLGTTTTEAQWRAAGDPEVNPVPGEVFVYNGKTITGNGTAYAAEGTAITGNPGDFTVGRAWEQRFVYKVAVKINSLDQWPDVFTAGNGKYSSGVFSLDFLIEDYRQPYPMQVLDSLSIQIDNFFPESEYKAPRNVSSARYWVEGEAKDSNSALNSGAIGGIQEVLAYFNQGGKWYNPNGDQWTAQVSGKRVKDMANSGTIGDFANYPDMNTSIGAGVTHADGSHINLYGAARINAHELNEDSNRNGYIERFDTTTPGILRWGFQFDSTRLADGPVELHYIVIDLAGNATHYKESLVIRNKPPVINRIILKTDYSFDHIAGSIASERKTFEYSGQDRTMYQTTNFKVRNYRLTFDIETVPGSGNGGKTFSALPVTISSAETKSTSLSAGKVYIVSTLGNTDWSLVGAASSSPGLGAVFICTGPAPGTTSTGQTTTGGAKEIYDNSFNNRADKIKSGVSGNTSSIAFGGEGWNIYNLNPVEPDFREAAGYITDSTSPNGSLFLVKVVDSTVPGSANVLDQNSDVVLVGLNINNIDTEAPKVEINPFHWNSETDNSLYNNSRNNGHIELEDDLPSWFNQTSGEMDRDPKVSGKISIRGTATDNNVINTIQVRMNGHILDPYAGVWYIYAFAAQFDSNSGTLKAEDRYWNTFGWKMTVEEVYLDENGHKVNWQLDLDTSFRQTNVITALDQAFDVVVFDFFNSSGQSTTQTKNDAKTPYYRMDVVPYISGISTTVRTEGGLKNNNIRSADGKYSVIKGDNSSFITVTGFNLNVSSAYIQKTDEGKGVHFDPGAKKGAQFSSISTAGPPYTSFTMTNNQNYSGYLAVFTEASGKTIGSLNNANNNDSLGSYRLRLSSQTPYNGLPTSGTGKVYAQQLNVSNGSDEENMPNREADRYLSRNITLTDDRYIQFFTVHKTNVKNGYNPVMIMNKSTDNPVFGYVDLSGGPETSTASGGAGTYFGSHAMPQRGEFKLSDGSQVYKEYLIKASIWDGMGMAQDESGRYLHATTYNRDGGTFTLVYDRYVMLDSPNGYGWGSGVTYGSYSGTFAHSANVNAIAMETVNLNGLLLDRYQYPKIIARGSSVGGNAAYYMTYYDNQTSQLAFRHFQIGNNPSGSQYNLHTGGQDRQGRNYNGTKFNFSKNGSTGNNTYAIGRFTAANDASNHFDMAVSSDSKVVIAYYDENKGRLALRYSEAAVTGASPTTAVTWKDSPAAAKMPDYTGTYVSMEMDSANGLHIAAFDALDSVLRYIYVPDYTQDEVYAVTVDQYGSVGNWTGIKLKDDTPYISYYNATESGGRDSIKMAYAKAPVKGAADVKGGVDDNGYTTGSWEYRTVPARDPPQGGSSKFQKVNLGFTNDGRPVLGYLGTNIEFSYPLGEP